MRTNTWAVAFIDFFHNDLVLKTVKARSWKEAFEKALPDYYADIKEFDSLKEAKEEAFNQDWLFEIKEIADV